MNTDTLEGDTVLAAAERVGWGHGTARDHEVLAWAGHQTVTHQKTPDRSPEIEAALAQDMAQEFARMARRARERILMGIPCNFNGNAAVAAAAAKTAMEDMRIWEKDQFYS